jgi:3'(2'), 5'-bisphosphate nucleotidase
MKASADMSQAKRIISDTVLLNALKQVMWDANDAILTIYHSDDFGVDTKSDDSPVTKADLAAHHLLVDALAKLTPYIPVVSEEDNDSLSILRSHAVYWLIDPLDGTKEFLKRNDEFTCNLALIENNRPTLGLVSVPVKAELYVGGKNLGASKEQQNECPEEIQHKPAENGTTRVVASKSHLNEETQAFIDAISGEVEIVQAGSSLKFLKIATGEADLYPRLAPTCEWDTAAAQAVLEGAGGYVTQANGDEMKYGKQEILNPYFIAKGSEY